MEALIAIRYQVHLHQVDKAMENYRRLKELEARYEKRQRSYKKTPANKGQSPSESLKRIYREINGAMTDIALATEALEEFEHKILEIDIDDLILPFIDVKKRKVQKQVLQEMLHPKSESIPKAKPFKPLTPLKYARKASRP